MQKCIQSLKNCRKVIQTQIRNYILICWFIRNPQEKEMQKPVTLIQIIIHIIWKQITWAQT